MNIVKDMHKKIAIYQLTLYWLRTDFFPTNPFQSLGWFSEEV